MNKVRVINQTENSIVPCSVIRKRRLYMIVWKIYRENWMVMDKSNRIAELKDCMIKPNRIYASNNFFLKCTIINYSINNYQNAPSIHLWLQMQKNKNYHTLMFSKDCIVRQWLKVKRWNKYRRKRHYGNRRT